MKKLTFTLVSFALMITNLMNGQCAITNHDFESWTKVSVKNPQQVPYIDYNYPGNMDHIWGAPYDVADILVYSLMGMNPSNLDNLWVFKSTDAHAGAYSLGIQYNPAHAVEPFVLDIEPCNSISARLEGYIKLTGGVDDSAFVSVAYTKGKTSDDKNIITAGAQTYGTTNGWRKISVDILPNGNAVDSMMITIGMLNSKGAQTAKLLVDDLVLTSANNTSLGDVADEKVMLFPNPSENGVVNFVLKQDANYMVNITDNMGKLVLSSRINQSNSVLDVSSLSQGVYFVQLNNNESIETIKLAIQ